MSCNFEILPEVFGLIFDFFKLSFFEPMYGFPIFPNSMCHCIFIFDINPEAMGFPSLPVSFINLAVGLFTNPISVFLVLFIFTQVLLPISPDVLADPVHLVILPLAYVLPLVWPIIGSKSINSIFSPLANILAAIIPFVFALSVFFDNIMSIKNSIFIGKCTFC